MNWDTFQLGFWHPFGPYTGLTVDQIVEWKHQETQRYGWTLWSFAYARSVDAWMRLLGNYRSPVYALCSESPGARDPHPGNRQPLATHFRPVGSQAWQPMPDAAVMKVTNAFKRGGLAVAFRVRRVEAIAPVVPAVGVEWYARSQQRWRTDPLPTRGEFLVRRGGSAMLRRVCAVLELESPYLVELTRDP